jgi:NTE family protein
MNDIFDTLVLSGGGVKGFCLLGAVQAGIDSGLLKPDIYIGTSVGAMISYLLAIGYTPIEIMISLYSNHWLEKVQNFNLVAMINGNGATSFTGFNEGLEKLTINKIGKFITLGKLKQEYGKTLICVTYNMTTCHTEYLGPDNNPDLPCITALRMSANIPLVFDRFKYMDNYYIDGGISDNFPILKGQELGKKILGLYLEFPEKNLQDNPEDGMMTYFIKLLQVPIFQSTKHRINQTGSNCTIIPIKTDLGNPIEFDVRSKTRLNMFSAGYNSVKENLKF